MHYGIAICTRCQKQYILIVNIKTKVKIWIDNDHVYVCLFTHCKLFALPYDKCYYTDKCLQYNASSNNKLLPMLYLKRHKKCRYDSSKQKVSTVKKIKGVKIPLAVLKISID